jgi:hypothetical protein
VKHALVAAALVLVTGGGVAFLLTNRPAPPAAPTAEPTAPPVAATPINPAAPCPQCQSGACEVVDVTDLTARFAAKSEASGEFISFDEPPLARPKGDLLPVRHDSPTPADAREVLPPPREAK